MTTVNNEIVIDAPLETIFSFVTRPSNLPQIWPNLAAINDEQLSPDGRYSAKWTYKIAGIPFHGVGEVVELSVNSWFTGKTWGPISSTTKWNFYRQDGKTRIAVATDYQVSLRVLNVLPKSFISKMTAQETNLVLANLQAKYKKVPAVA
jgi:ligand-binding SRPBCC domain-containing protein